MRRTILRALHATIALVILALPMRGAAYAQNEQTAADYPSYVQIGGNGELVLTPAVAARLVVERNLQLQAVGEGVQQAQGRVRQADAARRLQLSLSALVARLGPVTTFELPAALGGGSFEIGTDHMETATLSLTQPLYTGGRAELALGMARRGVAAAELTEASVRRALTLAAQEGAYGVLRLKQLEAVAAARVTAVAEHVRLSQVMEDAGVVAHFEVVQAQAELARAQQDLITAQTGVAQAKAALRNLVNFPQTTDLDVVDGPPLPEPEGDLPELIEQACANRPEIKLADTSVAIARMNLRMARAELRPSVALVGQYTRQTESAFMEPDSWQVGVAVDQPLLDGGTRSGKIAEANAALREAELKLRKAREDVALEVTREMLAVAEAKAKIEAANEGIVEARERRRMAQLRYREGISPGIEVLDADTALAAAQADQVNAEYDLQLAVARLRAALGLMDVQQQEVETQ
ncbi:MAG: TolC family protein [Armatimonadetes bacterium]|nr:TolC family protein [Armatimonadota bacterium]